MRKGINISKEQQIPIHDGQHRVIFPLHIPTEEGYYEQAYSIFEISIHSLIQTANYKFTITVVSDGCCDSVNLKLNSLFNEGKIQELILEKNNIGKINSILKVLRTVKERYVTIADADVLFLNNWDVEVFKIFEKFKKTAVVSPTPIFRNQMNYTANIWVDYLFSKKLQFRNVKNPDALEKFAQSLGWNSLEPRFKDVIMTLESQDKSTIAVVGATHFVATYQTTFLKNLPKENSVFKLGGNSEGLYLDKPPFDLDGYRLTTYDNFAYHMGNTLENWMELRFNSLDSIERRQDIKEYESSKPSRNFIKITFVRLFLKIISNRKFYNYLLLNKGLSKEKLKSFWY